MKKPLYCFYQPNDRDKKNTYGDCVIRALSKATGMSWIDVFDELLPFCRQEQALPSSQIVYEAYLKVSGFKYSGIRAAKGTKRPTVASFAADHPVGIYVLRVAHHLVTVADGQYFDVFDSGRKSLYGYWEAPSTAK